MSDMDDAARKAEEGIAASAASADKKSAGWSDVAAEALGWAATQVESDVHFTIEELRAWPELQTMLAAPPDLRAWGHATRRAVKLGYIVATGGFAATASSNCSAKPLYAPGKWS
jgi:hypothetical protein